MSRHALIRTPDGRLPIDQGLDGDHDVADPLEDDEDIALPSNLKASGPATPKALRDFARSFGFVAIRKLVHLMNHSSNHRVQLGAAGLLLDRGFGHAAQEIKFSDPSDPKEIQRRQEAIEAMAHNPEHLRQTIEMLKKAGVLSPPDAKKAADEAPEPRPQLTYEVVNAFDPPPQIVEMTDEERREEELSTPCAAERCRHQLRSHPGTAACEQCRCPMYVRREPLDDAPREVEAEVVG